MQLACMRSEQARLFGFEEPCRPCGLLRVPQQGLPMAGSGRAMQQYEVQDTMSAVKQSNRTQVLLFAEQLRTEIKF